MEIKRAIVFLEKMMSPKLFYPKNAAFFLTFPFKQIDLELGFDMNLMIFISFHSSFFGSLLLFFGTISAGPNLALALIG